MTVAARRTALTEIVEPLVAAKGFDLEDLSITRAGKRLVFRIVIDADGGVNLDQAAEVSRFISQALDGESTSSVEVSLSELVQEAYTLEVTSPGVDRPLKLPRHWRRNIGRLVRVRIDQTLVVGRIQNANETMVTLEVNGEQRQLRYDELSPGTVQVEFNRREEESI